MVRRAVLFLVVTMVLAAGAFGCGDGGEDEENSKDSPPLTATVTRVAENTPTSAPTAAPSASPAATPRQFPEAEQKLQPGKTYRAAITTNKGVIVVELFADVAPNTVNSFVFLASQGYFDKTTIHRIVKNFVIQGGDPLGNGTGGPGYSTQDEPNQKPNARGTISMAKVSGQSSFGSQFFINLRDNTSLDYNKPTPNKFYPFGEVIEGMDVVDAIANSPVGRGDKPAPPIVVETVVIEER